MIIKLNGEKRKFDEAVSLKKLLDSLDLNSDAVVVELNCKIIRKQELNKVFINNNDEVEIVHFVGGG